MEDPLIAADAALNQAFSDLKIALDTALLSNADVRARTAGAILADPLARAEALINGGHYFELIIARLA
jgi:hypothetical protein